MLRIRSLIIVICASDISPELVRIKLEKGSCWTRTVSAEPAFLTYSAKGMDCCDTYEYILPSPIVPLEVEPVLPEVGGDGTFSLKVHKVGVAGARVPAQANTQREVLVLRHVVRDVTEDGGSVLFRETHIYAFERKKGSPTW